MKALIIFFTSEGKEFAIDSDSTGATVESDSITSFASLEQALRYVYEASILEEPRLQYVRVYEEE